MKFRFVLALATAAVLAGCAGTTTVYVPVTPAPSIAPPATGELLPPAVKTAEPTALVAPTPEPTLAPGAVGDTIWFKTESGDCKMSVTIVSVVAWKSKNQFEQPDAGNRFLTVDVKMAGVFGACPNVGYGDLSLQDANSYVYDSVPAWREPGLPYGYKSADLKPGMTRRGWVTFELPKTVTTGFVMYADAEWSFTVD